MIIISNMYAYLRISPGNPQKLRFCRSSSLALIISELEMFLWELNKTFSFEIGFDFLVVFQSILVTVSLSRFLTWNQVEYFTETLAALLLIWLLENLLFGGRERMSKLLASGGWLPPLPPSSPCSRENSYIWWCSFKNRL